MELQLSEEDAKIIQAVDEKIFSSIKMGVNLSELGILDDVDASKESIQALGAKIAVNSAEISVTILRMAHSVYFDYGLHGDVPDFFNAVMRMGGDRIKVLIISLALFSLGKGPAARMRAAKSAGIGILSRMIAEQMNLKDDLVRKVETGGMLAQLGRNVFMKARELGEAISDDFIQKYEALMARVIIDRLKLDPFLRNAVEMSTLEFDEESLSLTGIIKLAEAITEDSFRRHGKLVLRSPMPDANKVLVKTPGEVIQKLFAIIGVGEYLEVRETPTQRQIEAEMKRRKLLDPDSEKGPKSN